MKKTIEIEIYQEIQVLVNTEVFLNKECGIPQKSCGFFWVLRFPPPIKLTIFILQFQL
jgi:hypothetical protein